MTVLLSRGYEQIAKSGFHQLASNLLSIVVGTQG
jgi:hypothetical protein